MVDASAVCPACTGISTFLKVRGHYFQAMDARFKVRFYSQWRECRVVIVTVIKYNLGMQNKSNVMFASRKR